MEHARRGVHASSQAVKADRLKALRKTTNRQSGGGCPLHRGIFALPGRAAVGLAVGPDMAELGKGTRRIFILEDERPLFEILKMMLETRGWRCVAHAANSLSKEETADLSDRIDAALLDLNAGDTNGFTVAGELRRLNPALPIVVMTGNSDAGLRERVAALRFSAVLQKPFSIASLEEALETALAG